MRINYLSQKESSSLHKFGKFFKHGLSPEESVAILSATFAIEQHHRDLTSHLDHNGDGWLKYGQFDSSMEYFDFNPSLFVQSLRDELLFREALASTQLFSGYVDSKRVQQVEKKKMMASDAGRFIASWLYFHSTMRKSRRTSK